MYPGQSGSLPMPPSANSGSASADPAFGGAVPAPIPTEPAIAWPAAPPPPYGGSSPASANQNPWGQTNPAPQSQFAQSPFGQSPFGQSNSAQSNSAQSNSAQSQFGRPRSGSPVGQAQPPAAPAGGADGHQLTQPVNGHLDYVSQLSRQLGVNDPVESYLTPVVGRWSDLHAEAGRWRTAGATASAVTATLNKPLAGLDAAWSGPAADSFLDYMQSVGLAGNDLAEAMNAMADALDKTADGIRQIVTEMVGLLADTAEQASDAMSVPVGGEDRARQLLTELDEPTSQLYTSVREVLEAFVKMCDGAQSGTHLTMAHDMPSQNWSPPATSTTPITPPRTGTPQQPAQPVLGQPVPGQPGPGHTVPGQSAPGQPAPGHPAPGQPAPAQPVPGQQVPGQPGPGQPAPAQPTAPTPTPASTPASPNTLAAAATGAGQHAAAGGAASGALGAAHLGGGAPAGAMPAGGIPGADGASAAAQHQAGAVSGAGPDTSSADQQASVGSADGAAGAPDSSSSGSPMMGGMGGMRGGQGGGDQEHKSKIRVMGDPKAIFGKVERTAPPVIGDE
ncbi:MAG TPA: WXG100 family type VII secretion target [Pseudonocardiaceae bacterium]|jgi:uncharacterized protein YukE|nr:WXG100 family type VII secretion target [Pseudonocardiaceae bacterium]